MTADPSVERIPNMDALRGIAAMAVLLFHAATELAFPAGPFSDAAIKLLSFAGHGGDLGVLFFFMLSGYLITFRMLAERARTGRFRLGRFYLRRVLRIWPLYYASLIIGFLLLPPIMSALGRPFTEEADPWLYALFLANFDMTINSPPTHGMLGVHWSVAIEEQFYLIWPLIFLLLRPRWMFTAAIAVIVIGSEIFVLSATQHAGHFHVLGNLRYLGIGALLAILAFHRGDPLRAWIDRIPASVRSSLLFLGVPLLFAACAWAEFSPARLLIAHFAALAFFSFVLMEQSRPRSKSFQLTSIPFADWLGVRSYGIYLLHMLALVLVWGTVGDDPQWILLSVTLTVGLAILLAHLSHRFLESPFLRMKDRFA